MQSKAAAGVVVRKLPPGRVVSRSGKERQQYLVRREPDSELQPQVAIVRRQNVLAALERHRGARLNALVPLAGRREGDLSLPVELETAIFEHALHQHRAKHRYELLVAQPMTLEGGARLRFSTLDGHDAS